MGNDIYNAGEEVIFIQGNQLRLKKLVDSDKNMKPTQMLYNFKGMVMTMVVFIGQFE